MISYAYSLGTKHQRKRKSESLDDNHQDNTVYIDCSASPSDKDKRKHKASDELIWTDVDIDRCAGIIDKTFGESKAGRLRFSILKG